MRVLLLEDEQRLAANIKLILEQEMSYMVTTCFNGEDGYALASTEQYDLIILDLMLPGMDGLEILQQLRTKQIGTPILILSARSSREVVVQGLKLGADDYVTKPFDLKELMARCQALIRRCYDRPSSVIQVGDLKIDTNAKRVYRNNAPIALAAMEYRVLEFLALRAGRIVSKSDIEADLYHHNMSIKSNVVEAYISALRKQFDPHAPHRLIHTIRRQGYLLEWRP